MAAPQSDIVRFPFNVPQQVALKFAGPKLINTKIGERALFTLTDGRVMFLEPKVAESIEMLSLHPGEEFYIAKRSAKDRGEYWDVWLSPDTEKIRARKETGAYGVQPSAPDAHGSLNGSSSPILADSPWFHAVREETKQKLALYHELCGWAKQNLEGITRNEVRAILMNCLISAERRPAR
jgi:hypothetical protein